MSYLEEWTVVINKSKYVLNDKESKVLKEQIAKGKPEAVARRMADQIFGAQR